MTKHYFCPECGGLDYTPHECRTEGCPLKGHQLVECDCDNPDSHKKAPQNPLDGGAQKNTENQEDTQK